jgi:hypothetical protein
MPFRQTPASHTPYVILAFDKTGNERNDDPDGIGGVISKRILSELQQSPPSDMFIFSHGWQGDVASAIQQYDLWIDSLMALSADAAKMGPQFRPVRIGLHWPSKPWGDEGLASAGAGPSFDIKAVAAVPPASPQSQILEQFLDRLNLSESLRGRELLGQIFRENQVNAGASRLPTPIVSAYQELAQLIGYQSEGEGASPSADNAPFDPQAAFDAMNSTGAAFGIGGALSGILGPLGTLSFWTMKQRARTVGEGGMFQFVAQAQQVAPRSRIHLIGHSFGCIVVSSICNGPNGKSALPRQIDTLTLLEGALSLWAYADAIPGTGGKGYYNGMIHRPAVRGPIVTTQSAKDIAVNVWYPAAVGLVVQDPSFAISTTFPVWGAIGAFGIQGMMAGTKGTKMLPETSDYPFENGKIYNLEATQYIAKMQGASGAHSDVYEPQVMHALWQSVFTSSTGAPATTGLAATTAKTMVAGAGGAGSSAAVATPPAVPPAPVPPADVPKVTPVAIGKVAPVSDKDLPIPFGIHAATGLPLAPVNPAALNNIPRGSMAAVMRSAATFGLTSGLNADDLADAGWGIVFANNMDATMKQAIREALRPLLELREEQAKGLFKIYDKPTGYEVGDTAQGWVEAHGGGQFNVVPGQGLPYYLMLIGSPDDIPFDFQYNLDIFYAVGRLCFRTPEEYATYAANIVRFEKGTTLQNRSLAMFNTRNLGDRATSLLHDQVALPLLNGAQGLKPLGQALQYNTLARFADDASKAELLKILRGQTDGGAPALLYTGSHGVDFSGDPNQIDKQGALLTNDWMGGPVTPDTYLTSDEVPNDAKTLGLIHYMFACYGAGCPQFDTYSGDGSAGAQIANSTFVARLPQKLLLSGAQAVIGHIDRSFAFSFQNSLGQSMFQGFYEPLIRLLQGRRVGDAMDVVDERWTALTADLLQMINNRQALPSSVPDALLANRWVARDDARNYVVLGDPAARLRPSPPAPMAGPQPTAPTPSVGTVPFASAVGAAAVAAPAAVGFAAHIDRKPTLKFQDFTGVIPLKAAVSPDCSFQLVDEALQKAGNGSKVDVYIYSISAPYLMGLLQDAQNRGATIRVMYDPVQMPPSAVNTLKGFGLDIREAPSHDPRRVFTVCHQKFLVIDRSTLVVESANWAASSIPDREPGKRRLKGNREWLIRADHEGLAGWYGDLFQADWDIPAMEAFGIAAAAVPAPLSFRAPKHDPPHDFPVTPFTTESMTIRPLTSPDNYISSILPLLQGAQQRIWLQQQYIEGKGGPSVPRLLEAIAKRRAANVDVKIMVSSRFSSGWDQSKETLQSAGLEDTLRAINLDNFTHCHNKGVIVDDAVVVSSTNWSENSISRARESGMLIHSEAVTDYFAGVFDDDWNTGWSVATADSQASSFAVSVSPNGDTVEVDPADMV